MNLKSFIRDIYDFPKEGIIFRDITPLLANADAFNFAVENMAEPFKNMGIQKVAAVESRGFFFGPSVAIQLGCGFIPVRKLGKLPWQTDSQSYSLEYGEASIEIHKDAFCKGEKVLLLDDVLATGGTINASINLVEKQGAVVSGIVFLTELEFLCGRENIKKDCNVVSLIKYS